MRSLKTIQKLSSLGSILSKIAFILSVVGFCGCIAGLIGLRFGSDAVLKLGNIRLQLLQINLLTFGHHFRIAAARSFQPKQ